MFNEVMLAAHAEGLLSDECFGMDGTLIKSFRPKDGPLCVR